MTPFQESRTGEGSERDSLPRPRADFTSHGGGRQTVALLVLAATERFDCSTFLFANTGDDSEDPRTLAYHHEHAVPFAEKHGIELVELRRHRRNGSVETLLDRLNGPTSPPIPFRKEKDGAPMIRSCTVDFKVRVVGKEIERRGFTAENPAKVAIGFSVDEVERVNPGVDKRSPVQDRVHPLVELGFHVRDCLDVIRKAGLPQPPPSSCWFCPHHDGEHWRSIIRDIPDHFDAACALEARLGERTGHPVYFTRTGRPLGEVIDDSQGQFDLSCGGSCFT